MRHCSSAHGVSEDQKTYDVLPKNDLLKIGKEISNGDVNDVACPGVESSSSTGHKSSKKRPASIEASQPPLNIRELAPRSRSWTPHAWLSNQIVIMLQVLFQITGASAA